jgi:hypothetical protein
MSRTFAAGFALVIAMASLQAQTKTSQGTAKAPQTTTKKAPATTAKKPVAPQPALKRAAASVSCPSELGVGVTTKLVFCDVLAGRDPAKGVLVEIPPHRGNAALTFNLHNRHTYSEEETRAGRAYARYTATIGVLTLDNTLLARGVVQSEFRTASDRFDRIAGGAGPGGIKAVAPVGSELISVTVPATVTRVSLLGEKLVMVQADGTSTYSAPGRPIAVVSDVQVEYRPGPAPRVPKR